ncbi:hypothetical protein GGI07_003207 [Coemansia sp. Benny D115]|nr:hypothetical protein GGI07_003207 [Coemansia sp. Benny D115]
MKLSFFLASAVSAALFAGAAVATAENAGGNSSPGTRYSDELEAESAAVAKKVVPKSDHVIELDKHRYLELLKTHDNIFIEFYANWCAACHGLSPEFNDFAEQASKKYPHVAVARADITKIEYLSSSFMVSMLPELVFIHRPAAGKTPETRFVTANFTAPELLDYIGGGWMADTPAGDYSTVWCTPTNLCGHVGGLIGEFVVVLDQKLNPFDIPPWAFMAAVVSVVYVLGQLFVGYLASAFRKWYHDSINQEKESEGKNTIKPVYFDEYRSDVPKEDTSSSKKTSQNGTPVKRAKGKRSKKD